MLWRPVDVNTVKVGQCGQHYPSCDFVVDAVKDGVTSAGASF